MDPLPAHTPHPSTAPAPAAGGTSVGAPVPAGAGTLLRLTLAKEGHHYVFTYEPGRELDVLTHLVTIVQDPGSGLDWYDAAVLAHQMGAQMTAQLERLASELSPPARKAQP